MRFKKGDMVITHKNRIGIVQDIYHSLELCSLFFNNMENFTLYRQEVLTRIYYNGR